MLHVNKRLSGGQGLAPALLRRAPTVELDWDIRQKSRFECTDSAGRRLGVFLPRGTLLRGGDVLVAEDGSLVRVLAAPQLVLRVRPCDAHGQPFDLTRAAYHLGNRHVALELRPEWLQLEPDHVLADMLRAMHLAVDEALAPFEPEGGAYGGQGHGHAHTSHGHAHGDDAEQPVHAGHGPLLTAHGHTNPDHAHAAQVRPPHGDSQVRAISPPPSPAPGHPPSPTPHHEHPPPAPGPTPGPDHDHGNEGEPHEHDRDAPHDHPQP